jgi:hypothetical protein
MKQFTIQNFQPTVGTASARCIYDLWDQSDDRIQWLVENRPNHTGNYKYLVSHLHLKNQRARDTGYLTEPVRTGYSTEPIRRQET